MCLGPGGPPMNEEGILLYVWPTCVTVVCTPCCGCILLAADVRLLSRPGLTTLVVAIGYPSIDSPGGSPGFSTFSLDMEAKTYTHLASVRYGCALCTHLLNEHSFVSYLVYVLVNLNPAH